MQLAKERAPLSKPMLADLFQQAAFWSNSGPLSVWKVFSNNNPLIRAFQRTGVVYLEMDQGKFFMIDPEIAQDFPGKIRELPSLRTKMLRKSAKSLEFLQRTRLKWPGLRLIHGRPDKTYAVIVAEETVQDFLGKLYQVPSAYRSDPRSLFPGLSGFLSSKDGAINIGSIRRTALAANYISPLFKKLDAGEVFLIETTPEQKKAFSLTENFFVMGVQSAKTLMGEACPSIRMGTAEFAWGTFDALSSFSTMRGDTLEITRNGKPAAVIVKGGAIRRRLESLRYG